MRSSFFLVCCYAATFSELMGPVVRDTTDQMRIAFSHQLLVLLLDIGDGHQHVTQKQHEIKSIRPSFYVGALSPCWKYYHSNNWKGNCRKSWTDLQVFFFFFLFKKKKKILIFFHFLDEEDTFARWIYLFTKSNEKWNVELLICCCSSLIYITWWLKPVLIYTKS